MLPQWRNIDEIPYDKMRDDDKFWIPSLINNQNFEMEFTFDENAKLIDKNTN
jgi:8-oxo-dGTP diphosphatase